MTYWTSVGSRVDAGDPANHRVLLVHQFALPRVSGLTITVAELIRSIPEIDPGVAASSVSYEQVGAPDELMAMLDRDHRDVDSVVGFNLHIEAGWEHTLALAGWCRRRRIPLYLYAHDYWPHHRDAVAVLIEQFGAHLLAITPAIVSDLAAHGFGAQLLPAGVALPVQPLTAPPRSVADRPPTVAAVGRLVPRKRFADVVGAFCRVKTKTKAVLYMRVPPSLVYPPEQDRERLDEIRAEAGACLRNGRVVIDPKPRAGTDYRDWSVYVSASEYEGVSMTPLEAILQGCPFLLSDIAPHRAVVEALFPGRAGDFLFPLGDRAALAALLEHELRTRERRAEARDRAEEIHAVVGGEWSLRTTARRLVQLSRREVPRPAATTTGSG
jgi:glycosyltransferase involved in cell wall biosynthesis